ncbi:MAG: hypothetical protein LBG59_04710 [Candidatus Peribacteria bacterium]|jgi:hypothetical protein|nr:hypothetical protein [Candidatus Peribacteria bacterium]
MKFISKTFLEELKEKNADVFGKFWKENEDGSFSPAEGKEFAQNWSNNYAIDFGTDDSSTTTTRTETPETAN